MTSAWGRGTIAFDLLKEAHDPDFAATYYRDKVVQRPLYLKPTPRDESEPNPRDLRREARDSAKARKRRSPGKPKPLSAKQKRALQIYKIPKDQLKYEIYVPLHRLWCGYMREVLSLDKPDSKYGRFIEPRNAGPLLTSADYHGALVEVVRSRCVSRVGVKGIVVRDTKSTFEIVTSRNELKSELNRLEKNLR
jgi:ribonuclease P protein subunit POP4